MPKRIVNHQFSLFGFVKPMQKVPISADKIKKAKAAYESGDMLTSAKYMREVRESLERFEKSL